MCHAASKLGSSANNPFMVDKKNEVKKSTDSWYLNFVVVLRLIVKVLIEKAFMVSEILRIYKTFTWIMLHTNLHILITLYKLHNK